MDSDGVGQPGGSAPWAAPDGPNEPAPDRIAVVAAPGSPGSATSAASVDPHLDPDLDLDPVVAAPPEPAAPLVPLTVSDLVDGAYNVVKRRPARVLGAVAVLVIPIRLVAAYALRQSASSFTASSLIANPGMAGDLSPLGGGELVLLALTTVLDSLVLFFIGGIVASFVVAWFEGNDLTTGAALGRSLHRGWAFLGAWALLLPVKVMSYLLCGLPLLVTMAFFCVTAPAIVVEGLGPVEGIKRSARLVSRRFWPTLWIVVLSTFVARVAAWMLGLLPSQLTSLLPGPFDWIGAAVVTAGAEIVATTALVATCVLLYFDLRVRGEGFDLAHRRAAAFRDET